MKIRHATRKAYTLSQILNKDFFRWLDDYFNRLESEVI